jgi:alkanesulfonate monooxygenase SsuD/methylene tetrahydromethanopterin reductase-like flavin-dependent oxidoreductase (luciferase family)
VQFAIQTPPQHTTFSSLRDAWQGADDLGYAAAFTFDHLVALRPGERPGASGDGIRWGGQLDGWLTLAALATATRRLRVGALVSGVTYRHPSVLAKMAVTLDHITGGRAILGMGAAWHEEEHLMFGVPFPPVAERMGRLEEALEIFSLLCRQDVTDFDGRYYQLRNAVFEPKPVRPDGVPVLVGGSGARLKRLAGHHAAIFNSFAAPWEWAAVNADVDAAAIEVGREPGAISRSAYVFAELSGDTDRGDQLVQTFRRTRGGSEHEARQRVLVGDPDDMIAVIEDFESAGVDMVILNLSPPWDIPGLDHFAQEVMPAFTP